MTKHNVSNLNFGIHGVSRFEDVKCIDVGTGTFALRFNVVARNAAVASICFFIEGEDAGERAAELADFMRTWSRRWDQTSGFRSDPKWAQIMDEAEYRGYVIDGITTAAFANIVREMVGDVVSKPDILPQAMETNAFRDKAYDILFGGGGGRT